MIFRASLDRLAKGVTIGITILFAAIIFGRYTAKQEDPILALNIINILLVLIYFITFAFRPKYYTFTNDKLEVNRLFKNVEIDLVEIKSVEQIGKEKLSKTMRTFGVGGLFGYFGKFQNTQIGSMTWYATRMDKAVLIVTNDNKKIILTPDNPEEFVAYFAQNSSFN